MPWAKSSKPVTGTKTLERRLQNIEDDLHELRRLQEGLREEFKEVADSLEKTADRIECAIEALGDKLKEFK